MRAHLRGKDDGVTTLAPVRDRFPRFADLLDSAPEDDLFAPLRAAESIGRPIGGDRFMARLERLTGRSRKPSKRGPKSQDRHDRGIANNKVHCHPNPVV
jgi:putative transposase